jgi:integrase
MAVYRPQYNDKKTGELRRTKNWYYQFIFAGRLIKESAKTTSKTRAKEAEKKRRRDLEEGFNGIADARDERIRSIRELAAGFLKDYRVRQPKSASFAEHAIAHVRRLLNDFMAVDVTDKTVIKYQSDRLTEGAAPKSINEEVGFLMRLLPVAHAGAIRAQLKQQKKLKLKVNKRVGKAYSPEEKASLLEAAKGAKRSKGIYLATMLAQSAGMRDKEIRTLQWSGFDLMKRIVTVGESKTDAGTGRTIPMNEDLFAAAVEYSKWYVERFKATQPDWYVFPAGRPRPNDPTRPQTTLKTAWRNARKKASVEGRFHDNRHTFVTDLAESGAGDEVIRDMAGHVSKDMLKHYSHIRMQAKRQAVENLVAKPKPQEPHSNREPAQSAKNSEGTVQDPVQDRRVN